MQLLLLYKKQVIFTVQAGKLSWMMKHLKTVSNKFFQLISGYTERDVIKHCSRVEETAFDEIVEKIKETIF